MAVLGTSFGLRSRLWSWVCLLQCRLCARQAVLAWLCWPGWRAGCSHRQMRRGSLAYKVADVVFAEPEAVAFFRDLFARCYEPLRHTWDSACREDPA